MGGFSQGEPPKNSFTFVLSESFFEGLTMAARKYVRAQTIKSNVLCVTKMARAVQICFFTTIF